jgi:hypothetical protein
MSEVKRYRFVDTNGYPSTRVLDNVNGARYVAEQCFDAVQAQLSALREELAEVTEQSEWRRELAESNCKQHDAQVAVSHGLQQRLAATEQRNAACNAEIVAMVESALRRSFSLGQVYWQQADSDSTCQQNKSDQTMEVQAQHILNVVKSINALTKPTESGASE